jgi:hypothetical protein
VQTDLSMFYSDFPKVFMQAAWKLPILDVSLEEMSFLKPKKYSFPSYIFDIVKFTWH